MARSTRIAFVRSTAVLAASAVSKLTIAWRASSASLAGRSVMLEIAPQSEKKSFRVFVVTLGLRFSTSTVVLLGLAGVAGAAAAASGAGAGSAAAATVCVSSVIMMSVCSRLLCGCFVVNRSFASLQEIFVARAFRFLRWVRAFCCFSLLSDRPGEHPNRPLKRALWLNPWR